MQKQENDNKLRKAGYDLTARDVADILNVSVRTLTNWYKWYDNPKIKKPSNMPKLPKFHQCSPHSRRFWRKSSISKLRKFQEWIPRGRGGLMRDINAQYWSRYREEWKKTKNNFIIKENVK